MCQALLASCSISDSLQLIILAGRKFRIRTTQREPSHWSDMVNIDTGRDIFYSWHRFVFQNSLPCKLAAESHDRLKRQTLSIHQHGSPYLRSHLVAQWATVGYKGNTPGRWSGSFYTELRRLCYVQGRRLSRLFLTGVKDLVFDFVSLEAEVFIVLRIAVGPMLDTNANGFEAVYWEGGRDSSAHYILIWSSL